MTNHLKIIISENWENYAYNHDKSGRINLEEALKSYIEHVCIHKKSIDRNINLYNK